MQSDVLDWFSVGHVVFGAVVGVSYAVIYQSIIQARYIDYLFCNLFTFLNYLSLTAIPIFIIWKFLEKHWVNPNIYKRIMGMKNWYESIYNSVVDIALGTLGFYTIYILSFIANRVVLISWIYFIIIYSIVMPLTICLLINMKKNRIGMTTSRF